MRRTAVLAVAVAATVAGAVLTSCSGSASALDQAQALVAFGGPQGWSVDTQPERATDDTSPSSVDGVPVTLTGGDQPAGARVRWSTPASGASIDARCHELVAWFDDAAHHWPSTIDTSTMVAACEKDADQPGDPVIAAGAGTAHGAYGRVTYEASVDDGQLVATLEFNAKA